MHKRLKCFPFLEILINAEKKMDESGISFYAHIHIILCRIMLRYIMI